VQQFNTAPPPPSRSPDQRCSAIFIGMPGLFSPVGSLTSLEGNEGQGAHRWECFLETQLRNFSKLCSICFNANRKVYACCIVLNCNCFANSSLTQVAELEAFS